MRLNGYVISILGVKMAQILILDDDPHIRLLLEQLTEDMGHAPTSSGDLHKGLAIARDGAFDLILLDLDFPEGNGLEILPDLLRLPGAPEVIIITGTGDTKGAEIAFNHGAWDYVRKPFLVEEVSLPIVRALQYHEEKAATKAPAVLRRGDIIGESPEIQRCLEDAAKAATTDSSVLIIGETGTGKELFAKAIHQNSKRSEGNFIVIDCGALPETLVESILFGHEKGAFTGAVEAKKGLIAQAEGGTLFMDEIGELPPTIQKTLLRTLQEHKLRPVGSKKELRVDFRLVAATNRNLDEMARTEDFRADLLFRIRGIEIKLPPLRDRIEDIRDITQHKLAKLGKLYGIGTKGVSAAFLEVLEKYTWPGNIRELMNVLEHSLSNAGSDPTLVPKHLPPKYRTALIAQQSQKVSAETVQPLQEFVIMGEDGFTKWNDFRGKMENHYLQSLQIAAKGNWKKACQLSGLSKTRLYELLKKYNLSLTN